MSKAFRELSGDPKAHYKFKHTLGTGAFGVVKLALCRDDNTEWAIKCIDQKNMTKEDEISLKEEITILGMLQHPNIVKLREVYHQPTNCYLVMEPMYGGELFDRIVSKQFYTEAEACDTITTIAKAIEYCHSKGIVHRDLKPENLLYDSEKDNARIAIADFGLAKRLLSTDELMTSACGTPSYVAPEVLENNGYDKNADYWSLGVICYILLCGFPPFYDDNNQQLFEAIKTGNYDFPSPYWDDISPQAIDFVTCLMTVNPESRLDCDGIVSHEWVRMNQINSHRRQDNVHLSRTITQMKKFNARRKFKAGAFLAMGVRTMLRSKK
jgi:calcium/calmodulin-dependent protein kinase I